MRSYFSFQWHITDECDQRCKHCYIFSGEGCKELKSMTWQQMQEVVANCEDFCKVYNRVPYFYITGGDPILLETDGSAEKQGHSVYPDG